MQYVPYSRAYSLLSRNKSFHDEITFLRNYFAFNSYHTHLYDQLVDKFLCNKHKPPANVPTVKKVFLSLPYLRQVSHNPQEESLKLL